MSSNHQIVHSEALTRNHRNTGLDQLRGTLAFTVMMYHLFHWEQVKGDGLFYRALDMAGLYFVSSFYILSGIAMMIAYGRTPLTLLKIADFIVKRFFRIMPLFWLVSSIAIVHMYTGVIPFPANFSKTNLLLSITGLFCWIQPRAYFSAGMWSIGNELAFYSLFPVFLYMLKIKYFFYVTIILGIVSSFAWANIILADHLGTSSEWSNYIHPLNQLCFFLSGMLIGWALNKQHFSASRLQYATLMVLGIALFFLVSNRISRDQAIVGLPKVFMLMVCVAMSVGAAGCAATGYAGRILEWLGRISYSLYLLHWPIYLWVNKYMLPGKDAIWVIISTLIASILLSALSFRWIESPFVHGGKLVSRRLQRLMPAGAI